MRVLSGPLCRLLIVVYQVGQNIASHGRKTDASAGCQSSTEVL